MQVLKFYASKAAELEAAVASVEATARDALASPLSPQIQVLVLVLHSCASVRFACTSCSVLTLVLHSCSQVLLHRPGILCSVPQTTSTLGAAVRPV